MMNYNSQHLNQSSQSSASKY